MNRNGWTRGWTAAIVTLAALTAGSATPGHAGRTVGPSVQRAPGAGGLDSDRRDPAMLRPSLDAGAGGAPATFGVVVSASPLQDDPTAQLPVEFVVSFEMPIDPATFEPADVVQDGTAGGVVWDIVNTGDDSNFQLRAISVQGAGTLAPSIPENAVVGGAVATNDPSVGVGNTVVYSGAAAAADPAYLYVGIWNPARIYTILASTPTNLDLVAGPVAVSGEADVRDMKVDPTGTRLYYASGDLRRFSFAANGTPVSPQLVAFGDGNLDSLAFNTTDSKLYATQNQGKLLVFDLPSGILVDSSDELIAPRGVIVQPDGKQVFAANGFDFMFSDGSQEIARYTLNNGLLSGGPFVTDYGAKPEHFAVDPCSEFLLHTQQPGHKVLTGDIAGSGAVTFGGQVPAGPAALRLLLVPLGAVPCSGSALYVVNELDDTVSVFHVNSSGDLTFLEDEDAGVRPQDLIKHPTADVLYVLNGGDYTGQSSISIYDIDKDTGELTYAGQFVIDQEGGFRLAIRDAS